MEDIKTREDIHHFVVEFYLKVQEDPKLAPIFNGKIEKDAWPSHLEKMTSFWSSVLFAEKGYKGNPFQHHIPLNIDASHFDQWISLFHQTINQHFEGPIATMAKDRAISIREIFESKLRFLKA